MNPKSILRIFLFLCICIILQQGPSILAAFSRLPIEFQERSPTSGVADLSSLSRGKYYVSVGRVLSDTEALIDGKTVQTASLTLGFPILVESAGQFHQLEIRWKSQSWRSHLYDFPAVTSYGIGVLIQSWRTFDGVYMGPVFCLLLLISLLVHSRTSPTFARRLTPHMILCISCLLYTFYLSGIPDLFWNLAEPTR